MLADTVEEHEFKVIYDDAYKDDGAIYIIYKINGNVAVLYLFADEETKKFHILRNTLYFMFEKKSEPSNDEIVAFLKQVEYYNNYYENIFLIGTME